MSDIVHLQFNPSPPPPENDKYKNDKLVFLRPPPPLRKRMTKFISYRCLKTRASNEYHKRETVQNKLTYQEGRGGSKWTVEPIYITKIQQKKTLVQCNEIVTRHQCPSPAPQICHSFKKTQKNDSDLTPPSLFARCHSFYRFFILKASLIIIIIIIADKAGAS